jgi:FtsP/CotA-like multicopper oxidase with cupredoxin domain
MTRSRLSSPFPGRMRSSGRPPPAIVAGSRPGRVARMLIGVLLLGGAIAAGGCSVTDPVDTVGKVEFKNQLWIPPLAPSRTDQGGRRVFDLRAQTGERDFGQGGKTPTWGFNGDYLGPTLRAKRGERVVVNVANALDQPTTVHWHGMHLPASMDGGPHQTVQPGATWSPTWTIDQPAAALWYHPHPHGDTETHVYRGLAGMFIVDDDAASTTGLPRDYGVDDFPVIVQDRNFKRDGRFDYERGQSGTGILGDTLLVNGTVGPYIEATTTRVRLRLLNASNARTYDFGLADDRPFALVGTDGGLLTTPYTTKRIRLSPAERAEIVVTLRAGERVTVRSFPPELGAGLVDDRLSGGGDAFDVLELRAAAELAPSPAPRGALAPIERIDPRSATKTRTFRLNGRSINGETMDMSRIDAAVDKGATEIWELTGQEGISHNFHIHGVQFQVLTVAGAAPPPELRGWKDTVFLEGARTVRVIVPFPVHADPTTPYMFHCHLLLHEDQGMMGQYVVTEPGQQAGHVHQHAGGRP